METLMNRKKNASAHPAHCLAFVHVPKTAGSTIRTIVRKQYGDQDVRYVTAWTQADLRAEAEQFGLSDKGPKVVIGHMIFGIHRYLSDRVRYITMLRNPIERVVSDYYYVLQESSHDHHEVVVGQRMTLEEYVQSGITIYTDNIQTRMLAGAGAETPFGACGFDTLEKALNNIVEHFEVVGLTEQFPESVLLFRRNLGWKVPKYKSTNKTRMRRLVAELTQRELKVIVRHNQLDLALYAYGAADLERKVSRDAGNIKAGLFVLGVANTFYTPAVSVYIAGRRLRNRIFGKDAW